jgi:hypothetical protein
MPFKKFGVRASQSADAKFFPSYCDFTTFTITLKKLGERANSFIRV